MDATRHTDFYEKRKHGKFRLVEKPDVSCAVADTHCHIEMAEDPAWTFVRCSVHNVKFLSCVIDSTDDGMAGMEKVEAAYAEATKGTEVPTSRGFDKGTKPQLEGTSVPKLKYTVGTHPHHAKEWNDAQAQNLREMLKNPKVTCLGEIGLDYHYDMSPRDAQIKVFEEQLKIAEDVGLPVALHLREAHDDALKVIQKVGWNSKGTLLHCFNLGAEELKPWVEAGCYVAIGGAVTFKKFDELREAVKLIPKDRLLTETDAPFMTPEPMRGMECYPDHVIFTAQKLYEILGEGESRETFYAQMYQNALDLLGD